MADYSSVPVLDMAMIGPNATAEQRAEFISSLGNAIRSLGFARLVNHGVSREMIAEGYQLMRQFFALDSAAKMELFKTEAHGNRGYIPFGMEKAKDAKISDLKEFFHVGQELSPSHPLFPNYGPNYWPSDAQVGDFRAKFVALFSAFEKCGFEILSCLAAHLGLPHDFFVPIATDGNSILRLIHYPALNEHQMAVAEGAVRAAAHEDINLLTLLPSATEGGLQILRKEDNKWIDVDEGPHELIIDTGDMMNRLTGGLYPATTHRVVNPQGASLGKERYSMPFFMHAHPHAMLDCSLMPAQYANCLPNPQPIISAGDFLVQRLVEIGIMKKKNE
eukprot:ANDGO_02073.mRNA.1 putative iron/ascorbate oxidoreductase DDB_G0283291